jgi:NADH:ubiquinone oxidoreductase subunit D
MVRVTLNDIIPTLKSLWNCAIWLEKECSERYGVNFSKTRVLNSVEDLFDKQTKSYQNNSLTVFETGPYYSLLGSGPKVSVTHLGGRIKDVVVETGYFYKGVEKLIEKNNLCQGSCFVERLNCNSSVMLEVAWFKTLEQLLGVKITDRSQVLRIIFMELSRISGHFHVLANISKASGSSYLFEFVFKLRDIVLTLFEAISGRKINISLIRFGGLSYDLPKYWMAKCWDVISYIEKELLVLDKNVLKNSIWIDKLSIGRMDYNDLINNGVSGPALRAVGINYDLRKRNPYYFYNDLDFEIPLGNMGTCYDLYMIRIEEIRQSCKIIAQLLDNIPEGSVTENCKIKIVKSDLDSKILGNMRDGKDVLYKRGIMWCICVDLDELVYVVNSCKSISQIL